jgi:hypothetical protein
MALPGDVCIGQRNVCLFRAALLDTDCSPLGGADSGIVTVGLVTMTASPEVEEGTVAEPKNGCGTILYTVSDPDVIKRYNLTGEFALHDLEMEYILFGGTVVEGKTAGPNDGETIGWASPGPDSTPNDGVYLEVIVQNVGQGFGDCGGGAGGFLPYTGFVFGKTKLTPGDRTFENDVANVAFTGKAFQNPSLYNGPWNDWPGQGYIPTSPKVEIQYTQAQYDAMLAVAGCGWQTLPAGS